MDILKDRSDILNFVKNVAHEEGIDDYTLTEAQTNEKGEGFLGQIFMVTVKDIKSDKRLHLVIKVPIRNNKGECHRVNLKCFDNEIYFYSEVYPTFKKFEQSKGINESIEFLPKYYKTSDDSLKEVVCLENLKIAKFEVVDKRTALDDNHISFIFKFYGRFHAYSYALKDQQPKVFKKLSDNLCNMYAEFLDDETTGSADSFRAFSKLVRKYLITGEDDEVIKKFEKYVGDGIVHIFRNLLKERNDFFTITHGDCWSNNMMFKYKETGDGKNVIDMRLIDLQLSMLASPVCDLSYCLYSSGCSKDIFDDLPKYLKIYYENFSSFLKTLGSDPDKLLPYRVLEEHWKKYAKFGMFMAIMVLKVKVSSKEEIKDFSDGLDKDELVNTFVNSKFDEVVYQKRIRELLHHMSEIDAL